MAVTVFVRWLDGDTYAVDAPDTGTVRDVKEEVARVAGVAARDFSLVLDGDVLGDENMRVDDLAVGESEVFGVVPSKGFEARVLLGEMGLEATLGDLRKVVCSDRVAASGEAKAAIVQLMLDCDITLLKQTDCIERTPLQMAALGGHVTVVKTLLANGADIHNSADPHTGWTPLHIASHSGHVGVVSLLLTNGANVSCQDNHGWRPLHWSAKAGCAGVTKLLLQNGARINDADGSGMTPLYKAVEHHKENIVRLLLDYGADLHLPESNGKTALHEAALTGHVRITQLLLWRGADMHREDAHGNTALKIALIRSRDGVVALLREWCAAHGCPSQRASAKCLCDK